MALDDRRGPGAATFDWPVFGEYFQRGAKAGKVEVNAGNARLLERLDALQDFLFDLRLQFFPEDHIVVIRLFGAGTAYQKNGGVGRGLVLDVQGTFRLC